MRQRQTSGGVARSQTIEMWRAPWITVVGPIAIVAAFDLVLLTGTPGAVGWLLAVVATLAGPIAAWIKRHSFLLLTATEVVVQNGTFVDRITRSAVEAVEAERVIRSAVEAVEAERDGVNVYFREQESICVTTARATGVLAGYLDGSRTAAATQTLATALGVSDPPAWMRMQARPK